jgi:hypothetical protein
VVRGGTSPGTHAQDDTCFLLDHCSSLAIEHARLLARSRWMVRCQAHCQFVVQVLRHSAATRDQVDAAVTTVYSGRLCRAPSDDAWTDIPRRLGLGVEAGRLLRANATFLPPCPFVVSSGTPGDCDWLRHDFWTYVGCSSCLCCSHLHCLSGAAWLGQALTSRGTH